MRVIELRNGFGIDALVAGTRPDPRPARDEVLVRMRAASLNYRDLQMVRGEFSGIKLPFIPISDGAGEVVALGSDVCRFRVGDRVCPCYVQDWVTGSATDEVVRIRRGSTIDGVLAEYVCVPQHGLVKYPADWTHIEAATLPIAAVTAWHALFVAGDLRSGQTLVVQGSGGVSIFALQFAASAGVDVIATSGSDKKLGRLREVGAKWVLNYKECDWPTEVLALTAGRGTDHVIDIAGGDNLARSILATRLGGTVSMIGYVDGQKASIDVPLALRRMVTLRASSVGSRATFEALVEACETWQIRPVVDRVFPVSDVGAALNYLATATHMGKVVLSFEGD